MAQVVLENIYKTFPLRQGEQEQEANTTENASPDAPRSTSNTVLRRINLTVEDGEFMVLVFYLCLALQRLLLYFVIGCLLFHFPHSVYYSVLSFY